MAQPCKSIVRRPHVIVDHEPDYTYLIGKMAPAGPPLRLEKCACDIVSLAAPCMVCTDTAKRLGRGASTSSEAPRQDGRFLLALCFLVLAAFTWVGLKMDGAPRPGDDRVGLG